MPSPGEDYPCFIVDEEKLFNFDDFYDEKYNGILFQKFGFFKVRLDSGIAEQATSIETFLEKLSSDACRSIKETIVIDNPVRCRLYGNYQVDAPSYFKEQYMDSATISSFVVENEENCCMKALAISIDAFLQHYYNNLESTAISSFHPKDITAIRSKAATSKAAFEARQLYRTKATMEEKRKTLDLGLKLEKITDCGPDDECQCDSCKHLRFEVPLHEEEPIGVLSSAGIEESGKNYLFLIHNFSMAHLCFKNLLGELGSVFGGVSFPPLYFGMSHSIFPIRVEDLSLWFWNFLLKGFPKLWLIVPPYAISKLTNALSKCGFDAIHKTCRNNLGHKFFLPTPKWPCSLVHT